MQSKGVSKKKVKPQSKIVADLQKKLKNAQNKLKKQSTPRSFNLAAHIKKKQNNGKPISKKEQGVLNKNAMKTMLSNFAKM